MEDLLTLLPRVLLLLPLLPQMLPPLLLLAATAAVAAAQLLLLVLPLLLLNEICTSIASCGFRLDSRIPGALRFHCPRGLSIPCRLHGSPWPPSASTASGC